MGLFKQFFVWWDGSTWGTRFHTWRKGTRVGEDEAGNVYYESAKGKRWVQYNGLAEASAIPAGWHGWIHYRVDTPPSREDYKSRDWELPHKPNMTGTAEAYRPSGSILTSAERPHATGDYQAWKPD